MPISILLVPASRSLIVSNLVIGVLQYYRRTARELKRLDSSTKSPIFAHFSETLMGLTSVRAFGQEHHFLRQNQTHIDANLKVFILSNACNR